MEQLTGRMDMVPNSNDYEKMTNKPSINGVELSGNKTSEELGLHGGGADPSGDFVTREELQKMLAGKVDAVEGMGLSSNDFTTEEKEKLDGIESGAQVNLEIPEIPSKVSELDNDSGFQTKTEMDTAIQEVAKQIPDVSQMQTAIEQMQNQLNGLVNGNEVAY